MPLFIPDDQIGQAPMDADIVTVVITYHNLEQNLMMCKWFRDEMT